MHREPTTRKPPLRAALSAQGSRPELAFPRPPSPPGPRAGAASARGVEALAGGGLRRARAPEDRQAAANGGAGGREQARAGRGPRGHSPVRARGAASSRGTCGQADGPGRRSHGEGESARRSRPVPSNCPIERSLVSSGRSPGTPALPDAPARPPPPSPAASPLYPFPSPLPPTPHRNGKYLPGRGAAGARLSEGQPTVTNSRRGSGGAGFLAANPEACR